MSEVINIAPEAPEINLDKPTTKSISEKLRDLHNRLGSTRKLLISKIVDNQFKNITLTESEQKIFDGVHNEIKTLNKGEMRHMRNTIFDEIEKKTNFDVPSAKETQDLKLNMKLLQEIDKIFKKKFLDTTTDVIIYTFLASLPVGLLIIILASVMGVEHDVIKKWLDNTINKVDKHLTSAEMIYRKFGKSSF